MRMLVTLLIALVVSWLAESMIAVATAIWTNGDETFILAFMAAAAFPIPLLVIMLIAATRSIPARALNWTAFWLIAILLLLLTGLSMLVLAVEGSVATSLRGLEVMFAIVGGSIAAIIAQWLVFRMRGRPAPPPMPRFGRGAAP